jgi:DNA-binding FadR family transcriptional regulator
MTNDTPFNKITKTALYLEVANQIKKTILGGKFQPGEKLPSERDLAKAFGVGRPAIREALMTLSERGLVEMNRGTKGNLVKKPDLLQGVSAMREQMSWLIQVNESTIAHFWDVVPHLVGMVANAALGKLKETDWQRIEQLLDDMADKIDDFPALLKGLTEIVRIEAQSSGNPVVYMLWQLFLDVLENEFPPLVKKVEPDGKGHMVLEFHRKMVEALRKEDEEEIERLVRKRRIYLRDAFPLERNSGCESECNSDPPFGQIGIEN